MDLDCPEEPLRGDLKLCERIREFTSSPLNGANMTCTLDTMVQHEARSIGLEGWAGSYATNEVIARCNDFKIRLVDTVSRWSSREGVGTLTGNPDGLVEWAYETLSGSSGGIFPESLNSAKSVRLKEFLSLEVRAEHQALRDEIIGAAFDTTN